MRFGRGRRAQDQGRVEQRRQEILQAAARVFARRGFHGARTREIAAEAGVAEGTIYNYYRSKRDLLIGLIERIIADSLPALLEGVKTDDPRALLAAVIRDRLELFDRHRDVLHAVVPQLLVDEELRTMYLSRVATPILRQLAPLLQPTFRRLGFRAFNPRVVVPAIGGGMLLAFLANEQTGLPLGRPVTRDELVDELVDLYLSGMQRGEKVSFDHSGEQEA